MRVCEEMLKFVQSSRDSWLGLAVGKPPDDGTQMKIKYKSNNDHVCHENVCFKTSSVLVKNMTNKVILGLPFINALYPFLTEHDGITTDSFGQKVKFKFASKFEIGTDNALNMIHA